MTGKGSNAISIGFNISSMTRCCKNNQDYCQKKDFIVMNVETSKPAPWAAAAIPFEPPAVPLAVCYHFVTQIASIGRTRRSGATSTNDEAALAEGRSRWYGQCDGQEGSVRKLCNNINSIWRIPPPYLLLQRCRRNFHTCGQACKRRDGSRVARRP